MPRCSSVSKARRTVEREPPYWSASELRSAYLCSRRCRSMRSVRCLLVMSRTNGRRIKRKRGGDGAARLRVGDQTGEELEVGVHLANGIEGFARVIAGGGSDCSAILRRRGEKRHERSAKAGAIVARNRPAGFS